jgi:hypothetical protein
MDEILAAHGLPRLGLPPGDVASSLGGKSRRAVSYVYTKLLGDNEMNNF